MLAFSQPRPLWAGIFGKLGGTPRVDKFIPPFTGWDAGRNLQCKAVSRPVVGMCSVVEGAPWCAQRQVQFTLVILPWFPCGLDAGFRAGWPTVDSLPGTEWSMQQIHRCKHDPRRGCAGTKGALLSSDQSEKHARSSSTTDVNSKHQQNICTTQAISLLGMYPRGMCLHKNLHTNVYDNLFIIVKIQK